MKRYYDKKNNRLVYIDTAASEQFWDSHWDGVDLEKYIRGAKNNFIIKYTSKYLPIETRILEGGCGRGDKVYVLSRAGYDAYGVDYARETVKKINQSVPELQVFVGDVRRLMFPDGFFDGYWSFGVIEHFYEGYEAIMQEMYRVIKNSGYLFMTVPAMSRLRKIKARIGFYPEYREKFKYSSNFYQFALDPKTVIENFEQHGFQLIEVRYSSGLKGLKDEVTFLNHFLQLIYDGKFPLSPIIAKLIDKIFVSFTNHIAFYIFRRK